MKIKGNSKKKRIRIQLDITRRKNRESIPYIQSVVYETDDITENVASALKNINEAGNFTDINGKSVNEIRWDHSCLQKKCGACAMVIDGKPSLACASLLADHKGKKPMSIEPLSKFPVIADLLTDRSILFENLKTMGVWMDSESMLNEKKSVIAYEASRCLQCGCCLEVCPNFAPGGSFFCAAGFVPAARLITALPVKERERIRKNYQKFEYSGCGKSLSCMNICPAGIDIDRLLVRMASAVLYNR